MGAQIQIEASIPEEPGKRGGGHQYLVVSYCYDQCPIVSMKIISKGKSIEKAKKICHLLQVACYDIIMQQVFWNGKYAPINFWPGPHSPRPLVS